MLNGTAADVDVNHDRAPNRRDLDEPDLDESLEHDKLKFLDTLGYPGASLMVVVQESSMAQQLKVNFTLAEVMTKATLNEVIKLLKKPTFDAAKVCQATTDLL